MRTCPHPTCDERIPAHMFACRRHWWSLPQGLRSRIWSNYRSGDLERIADGYAEAARHWGTGPLRQIGPDLWTVSDRD